MDDVIKKVSKKVVKTFKNGALLTLDFVEGRSGSSSACMGNKKDKTTSDSDGWCGFIDGESKKGPALSFEKNRSRSGKKRKSDENWARKKEDDRAMDEKKK